MNKSRFAGLALSLAATAILFTGCPQTSTPPNTTATPAKPATQTTPPPAATASATPAATASASATPGAVSAAPTEYTAEEAGISVTIPAGWQQGENNGTVVAGPADGTVAVLFHVPDDATMDNIGTQVEELLKGMIEDPKPSGEGKEEERNGMKAYSVQGTGTHEGKPCEWMVDFIANKKVLMVVYVGETAGIEKNQATLAEMIASIKPVGEASSGDAGDAPEASGSPAAGEAPEASESPAE